MGKVVFGQLVGLSLVASASFGSGLECRSERGYDVKLYSHDNAGEGTRIPAALSVSQEGRGTVCGRRGDRIEQVNLRHSIRYAVSDCELLNAERVVLEVPIEVGRTRQEAGQSFPGTLFLIRQGEEELIATSCSRALTLGERQ